MSALVASIEPPAPRDPAAQELFVDRALRCLSSRARGPAAWTRVDATVVGARETWPSPLGDLPCQQLASRWIGGARIAVAVSGSVDNAADLGAAGRRDGSIAAALLEAYLAEGEGFVHGVGGCFAIVVHDGRTRRTIAIRDRLGLEPLYYWHRPDLGRTVFGSEPKAILADPQFPREFDAGNLLDLLNSTSRTPGTTVYRELREVRPGEIITVADGELHAETYWSLLTTGDGRTQRIEEIVSAVAHETAAAVRRRMSGGEAFLLSGGLDSSAICAVARETLGDHAPLRTFSFVYEEAEADFTPDRLHVSMDTPYVTTMVRHLATVHTEVTVPNSDVLHTLERTVRARDMPGVGDLDMALLRLFDAVSGTSRIAFSGDGADNVFGGFPWFQAEWENPGAGFPWLRDSMSYRFLAPDVRRSTELPRELERRWSAVDAELSALPRAGSRQDHLDKVAYMELTRFLPLIVDRVDRMGAAAGMRVQLPFLDHRLVELVWWLPYDVKSTGGMEKGLLRKAFELTLPRAVAWRRKSGFAVGKSPHYRNAIVEYAMDALVTGDSPIAELLDDDYLRTAVTQGTWADGAYGGPPVLPRLVMLDMWARIYNVRYRTA